MRGGRRQTRASVRAAGSVSGLESVLCRLPSFPAYADVALMNCRLNQGPSFISTVIVFHQVTGTGSGGERDILSQVAHVQV